jgi:hypothetical protein
MPDIKKLTVMPLVLIVVRQLSMEDLAQSVAQYLSVHIPQEEGFLKRKKANTTSKLDVRLHIGMGKHSTVSCKLVNR